MQSMMASASPKAGFLFPTSAASPPSACPAKKESRRRREMLCKATAGGDFRLDRRDVLAGLTGVATAGGLISYPNPNPNLAVAAEPDADICLTGDKVTDRLLTCNPKDGAPCPPLSPAAAAVDFTPPTGPMRVRQPAHLADAGLVEKYKLDLARMRALPNSDPRSFASQVAIHQAYCDGHYRYSPEKVKGDAPFDVHFSWVFAPWHRLYIYFYERILGSLIGDDGFALPYWNWDAPPGMALPEIFKDPTSPLYDPNRNPAHVDAYLVLEFLKPAGDPVPFDMNAVQEQQYNHIVEDNLATVHNQMIRQGRGTRCFLGEKFCTRQEDQSSGTAGTLESKAHTGVHIWLGDPDSCMTAHDGSRQCGNDVLDAGKLRYRYDDCEPLRWMGRRPTLRRPAPEPTTTTTRGLRGLAPAPAPPVFPLRLREGRNVVVPSVSRPASGKEENGKLEVLVFDGVEFNPGKLARFDVAVNVAPEVAGGVGPRWVEYAGSYASLPRGGGHKPGEKTVVVVPLELPVEDVLDDIGSGDAVDVVIVPRTEGITIKSAPRIEAKTC